MKSLDIVLDRYGLIRVDVIDCDLRGCYIQCTPNRPIDKFLLSPVVGPIMINSPHYEIFSLYRKNGRKWLKQNYVNTQYCKMASSLGKTDYPLKIRKLFSSLKKGYLRKNFKNRYIVVLNEPFAKSRYGRDVEDNVPEIFIGHHRAGALLSLDVFNVKVVLAADIMPGTCQSYGKIHDACVGR